MGRVIIKTGEEKEIEEEINDLKNKISELKENKNFKGKHKVLKKLTKEVESINDDTGIENINEINKKLNFYEKALKAFESDINLDPGRLLGLTDGIFSIVMTLLIFGIAIPEIQLTTYTNFITFLFELLPRIGVTIVSFILLSTFWIYHHEFIKINKINIPYLWINMIFLISISFIPFTTSIIGNYAHFFLSEVIFGLNILLILFAFTLMYYYAYSRNFLEYEPTIKERKYVINTLLIIMLLTVIINLLDYCISPNFIYLFLLVPIITTIRDTVYKIKKL